MVEAIDIKTVWAVISFLLVPAYNRDSESNYHSGRWGIANLFLFLEEGILFWIPSRKDKKGHLSSYENRFQSVCRIDICGLSCG